MESKELLKLRLAVLKAIKQRRRALAQERPAPKRLAA
jgi:hypothetical protein